MSDEHRSVTSKPRTTLTRHKERRSDQQTLRALLDSAFVGHLGMIVERDGASWPVVLPVAFGVDYSGPDEGGTMYLHGSVAAGWLPNVVDRDVCVEVSSVDGLVLARSAFHHSMNYRSAVVIGRARSVQDDAERARALSLVVDHMVPGRSQSLREMTRRELKATAVLAVPLGEVSIKTRAGGPADDESDLSTPLWAGHLPLSQSVGQPIPDVHASGLPLPEDVLALQRGRT